jgi:hypothetical protein
VHDVLGGDVQTTKPSHKPSSGAPATP